MIKVGHSSISHTIFFGSCMAVLAVFGFLCSSVSFRFIAVSVHGEDWLPRAQPQQCVMLLKYFEVLL